MDLHHWKRLDSLLQSVLERPLAERDAFLLGVMGSPDPVQIDVGFASYRSRIEKSANSVKYWREYVVKNPFVGFDKLADLHRLEDAIGNDEFATVVLTKK